MSNRYLLLIAAGAALTAVSPLEASDFLTTAMSARSTASGGVFLPSSDGPLDAMAINPAGLSLIGGPTFEVGVADMFARGEFRNAANSRGTLNANGAIPYGAFAAPVGKSGFSFGLSLIPEMASAAEWNYVDTPEGVGKVSCGPMAHRSDIVVLRPAAGVGVSLSRRLKVGFYGGRCLQPEHSPNGLYLSGASDSGRFENAARPANQRCGLEQQRRRPVPRRPQTRSGGSLAFPHQRAVARHSPGRCRSAVSADRPWRCTV